MLQLTHLASFLAVLDEGTITRAAIALNYSQPTVTGHLQALERHLDVVLFERGHRQMTPTPAGERLAELARDMLALRLRIEAIATAGEQRRITISLVPQQQRRDSVTLSLAAGPIGVFDGRP